MDRKLVHIDELVKTKLRGEADASGMQQSWHKMEQLLNEQDEKTGGSFWKTGSWLLPVLLALITTTSIGGYWWANKINGNEDAAYTPATMQTLPVPSSVAVHDETALPVTKEPQEDRSMMSHTVAAATAVGGKEEIINNDDKKVARVAGKDRSKTLHNKTSKKISGADNAKSKAGNIERIIVDEYGYVSNINGDKNDASPAVASADNKALPVHNVEHLRKTNKQLEAEVKRDIKDEKYVIDKNDRILKKEERMVNTTNVRERTVREIKEEITTKVYDTVGKERYALIEYIPVSKEEVTALRKLTLYRSQSEMNIADKILIDPMYGARAASPEAESATESLASTNAGTGVNAASGSEESVLTKINQFFEIRKKFYASLFLGANTSAGHWVPLGFQVGAGLHYWASKKWTLGIEPAYAFRPMQYTFEDKASSFTQTSPGVPTGSGQYIINYEERSAVKSYSFNSVQSFELPLLAGYHFGNWTILAGPSVTFGLPLTYYKMEYNSVTPKVVTQINPELDMESTELRSAPEDFNARIGFGYMLGTNYNLNDRFGLNFRFSQVLGDNSKTNIGKQLSDEMFKAPSFRIGVHYKLGKTKKVMYMMDKDKR